MFEAAADVRQVFDHFNQPDDGDIFRIDQQLAAGGTHFFSAHAEEGGAGGLLAQRVNELRAVSIAGGFAGGEQKLHAAIMPEQLCAIPTLSLSKGREPYPCKNY